MHAVLLRTVFVKRVVSFITSVLILTYIYIKNGQTIPDSHVQLECLC